MGNIVRKLPIGIQSFDNYVQRTICMLTRPSSFIKWHTKVSLIS